MPENPNIKTPFKGMNLDNIIGQKESSYVSYALNATVEGSTEDSSIVYQNEEANIKCCTFPEGYKVCGVKNIIEEGVIIVMLVNEETSSSEIGKIIDCKYTTYVSHPGLNFSITDPIHEISYKRTNCDTEIYWASKNNPRRYISINKIPYVDDKPLLGLDLNKLLINPNFSIPNIEVVSVTPGGDTQAGVYQFTCQYANAIGEGYTSYYSVTNPTPLFNPNNVTLDFNYIVTKSINLELSNLDTTGYYDYINVVVIKTINNISTAELIGTYPITDKTLNVTYSGQKQLIPVTLPEIFSKNPIYTHADGVYNVQDVLGWYGPKTQERISYQEIASQIKLLWETYRLKGGSPYSNELTATNFVSYLRDEIYPFEIVFILKNGYQTDGFTIPSRVSNSYDRDIVNNLPRWKTENTATLLDFSEEYKNAFNKSTYEGPYQYGEFSYWESTEKYPNNPSIYGTLANTPIRHHKFPDSNITHIHDIQDDYIYPIGVRVDVDAIKRIIANSSLTQEQKDNIQSFKIVRGNRAANKTVVAKGIIRDVLQYSNNGTPIDTSGAFDTPSSTPYVLTQLNNIYSQVQSAKLADDRKFTLPPANIIVSQKYDDILVKISNLLYQPTPGTYPNIPPGILTPYQNLDAKNPVIYRTDLTDVTNKINALLNFPITIGTETKSITDAAKRELNTVQGLVNTLIEQYNQTNSSGASNTSLLADIKITNFYFPNYLFNDIRASQDPYLNNVSKPLLNTRYTFHSPDTSFYQPALGSTLKLETIEYGNSVGRFFQVRNHAGYKIFTDGLYFISLGAAAVITLSSRWFIGGVATGGTFTDGTAAIQTYQTLVSILEKCVPFVNYTYQFNAVGNFGEVPKGQTLNKSYTPVKKQTTLELYSYLSPSLNNVGDDLNVNNWQRETSVYLKTTSSLPSITSLTDTSKNFPASIQETVLSPISAYYASIKNPISNVWGRLYSYETIDTGFQISLQNASSRAICFGGDTFINKFSFKTKIPFFLDNRVGAPDGSDIAYDELANVGQPKYWYTSKTKAQAGSGFLGGLTSALFGTKAHQLYNDSSETLYRSGQMFLFAYGIPTFYCESTINVDLRQAFNTKEGEFYPHVGTSIPNDWLQEINVPIVQDNTYYYNKTYSKQNKETGFLHLPQDYTVENCRQYYPYRTIFSEVAKDIVNPEQRNNWLIYKPASFFDFPQNYGKLTSIAGIENKQALVRFENKTLLYNALYTAPTSAGQVYLGKSLFDANTPPLDFSDTDLGYIGSQHKFLLKTEYGIVSPDALRGQVFLLQGQQAKDISLQGMSKFFTQFLNFYILKTHPTYPIDNHFNGVGLTGVYDSRYNRLILTKLDYECKDKSLLFDNKGFYIPKITKTSTTTTTLKCADGYELKNGICERVTYNPATPTNYPEITARNYTSYVYGEFGTRLHRTYPINVDRNNQGTYVDLPANTFWKNTSPTSLSKGRLNQVGFWAGSANPMPSCCPGCDPLENPQLLGGPIAFTTSLEVASAKTYYIGIAVDNTCKITLNCEVVMQMTQTEDYNFKFWHIFPVQLKKGTNFLTVEANNDCGSIGVFGYEIYDNTEAELTAATQASDLNIIASSRDLWDPVETTLTSAQYTCGACNSVVEIDGDFFCPVVEQEAPYTITETIEEEKIEKIYVPFTDEKYFINRSFTVSYDFDNQAWISFHSYLPNFYIAEANYFYSGLNNNLSSVWAHQNTFTTFNKFYDQVQPYILEIPYQFQLQDEILQAIVDYHTVLKIDDFQSFTESDDDFFNKLIIYSNQQCSGLLELTKRPISNLQAYNNFPKYKPLSKEILYSKSDNLYKINTFWDVTINPKKPNFIASPNNLSEYKVLNQANMNYKSNSYKKSPLRTKEAKIRYILDDDTSIKIQTKINTIQSSKSYK